MQLKRLPEFDSSADWALYDLRVTSGLEIIVQRVDDLDIPSPQPMRRIAFKNPASWAIVDMSLMWQYFPSNDCPSVIEEMPSKGVATPVDGITINVEAHGSQWRCFRVVTDSEIVEVISRDPPEVTQWSVQPDENV